MLAVPQHIAIIMDGNGRWAQERGHNRFYGHVRGAKRVKEIVKESDKLGIKYLTLYAFSSENWKRPKLEINLLMKILKKFLISERDELYENNVCFKSIGEIKNLPSDIQDEIQKTISLTKNNNGLCFTLALSYGSQQEIANCFKTIYQDIKNQDLKPEDIKPELISKKIQSAFLPNPDLIIRTSGEFRLSNFLLWQAAYSEFYISQSHWPDFTKIHLQNAVNSYCKRERRYGRVFEKTPFNVEPTLEKLSFLQ